MSEPLMDRAWAVHAALDAFEKWRVYLPAAAFNHSDGLRFISMLSDAIASSAPQPCTGCAALREALILTAYSADEDDPTLNRCNNCGFVVPPDHAATCEVGNALAQSQPDGEKP